MIQCQIDIGKCLGFHTLCGIHNQDGTITRCKTPGYFIIKIHVSRRINQVKNIFLSILCLINDAHCLGFDRDSPLTLQIHIIENLCLHLTAGQRSCFFYDSIRKCRLTVINMGNNTKITNFALID